jgi:glycosyltransferase involved in cell wall biosynthesis
MSEGLLSIVIPVYNEGNNIRTALEKIVQVVEKPFRIAIVYDFEEDSTLPALDAVEKELGITVSRLRNKYGRGVLNAIKTGLEDADTEFVIVTMADLSDPPEVMNAMLDKACAEKADIVCASRYMKGGRQIGGPFIKGMMSRCAGIMLHYLAGLPTHDPTNSFKLYRTSFLQNMEIESTGGFELGLELVVKAGRGGYRVCEVPTTWTDRVAGKSNFKLMKWLPHYLHWFFYAFRRKSEVRRGVKNNI